MADTIEGTEKFVDGNAIADHLGVSYDWVWRAAKDGVIPAIRIGRAWRFRLSEVLAALEQRQHDDEAAAASG